MYVQCVSSVRLALTGAGAISAVHPPTPVLKPDSTKTADDWERVKWIVNAEVDGTMVDKATGLEVSYLFWEGEWSCPDTCVTY
jgi:hypothetical protein